MIEKSLYVLVLIGVIVMIFKFDISPTAKCYCKDCKNRFGKTCEELDIWVTDDFFCKSAEPSNHNPDLQREEGMK